MHLAYLSIIDDCLYSDIIAAVNKVWGSTPIGET